MKSRTEVKNLRRHNTYPHRCESTRTFQNEKNQNIVAILEKSKTWNFRTSWDNKDYWQNFPDVLVVFNFRRNGPKEIAADGRGWIRSVIFLWLHQSIVGNWQWMCRSCSCTFSSTWFNFYRVFNSLYRSLWVYYLFWFKVCNVVYKGSYVKAMTGTGSKSYVAFTIHF